MKIRVWQEALPDLTKKVENIVKEAWEYAFTNGGHIPEKGKAEISVFFVNDANIKEVNKEYRGIDKPTNVLSFQMLDEEIKVTDEMTYLAGDIFVSFETSKQEADEANKTLLNHLTHLLVHGVFHLAGFDHIKDEDAEVMENLEIQFLDLKGIKNPYNE